ncbi:hypothetical protein AKJ52_02420 [candidate division MSBL1 archaeon SCGC-AAA382C18]|uniref:histidine kinase n=1 Tax=candidate division MSBL1 archaeon SCGC-AAA382C18 TaxID=1698281 RepID=A0A133VIG8_9EURY|nr:hypothetical protein AKJ52_02420 [candidate division MSBL1 archaeon SCGC-AAA382C18]
MKVLLVDDEPDLLEHAKIFLENEVDDLTIETANSPRSALDRFNDDEIDAIVSDYQMPRMDGLEFLETIREEKDSDIPFIIFTGKGREEVAMDALNLGVDRYLQKGGNPKSQYGVLGQAIIQEVEHKEAREEIESLAKYPSENPDPVLRIERNGEVIYSNEAGRALLSKWNIDVGGVVPEKWKGYIENVFESEKSKNEEIEVREKVYSVRVSPVVVEGYANLYTSDITELKNAEERTRKLYRDIRETFNAIGEIAFLLDRDHNILMANKAAEDFFDKSEEELKNEKCYKLAHGMEDPIENCPLERTLEDNEPKETEFKHEDLGKYFLARTYPIVDGVESPKKFAHQMIDITERKKIENHLEESRNKFRSFFENEPEYCYMVSPNGKIIDVNKSALNTLGYKKEEIKGAPVVPTIYAPSSREKAKKLFEKWKNGEKIDHEELEIVTKDGEKRTVLLSADTVSDSEEKILYSVSVQRDITKQKKAEEREEFLHSLLRHDVQNKAQIVQGYLELLEGYNLPREAKEYIEKAMDGSRKEMDIIEKVRTLRRADEEKIKKVDVSSTICDNLGGWESEAEENDMEIVTECSSEEYMVKGGSLLDRIFSNIIENSPQHSEGSKIKISTKSNDGEVVCFIEDDGKGIPEGDKEKIFDRGFTTDEERGSGLGMFLVKTLLEIYKWRGREEKPLPNERDELGGGSSHM